MKYLWIIALGLLAWTGCSDEETLVASTEPEFRYVLPQGDHDYDDKIVQWYEDCGFYILYKFEPKDVYYNEDMPWGGFVQDTLTINESVQIYSNNGISVEMADEEYVGQQLAWIEEMLLNHYSKELLSLAMPKKIILGKNLNSCMVLGNDMVSIAPRDYMNTNIANTLIFSHGDETINELDNATLVEMKNVLHTWLLTERLYEYYPMEALSEFLSVTDYYMTLNADYYPEWESMGWILGTLADSEEQAMEEDIKAYIEMIINTPKEILEMDMDALMAEDIFTWMDVMNNYYYAGMLHESVDVAGNIKKKYDLLVEAFKDWGVDLEAIGTLYAE